MKLDLASLFKSRLSRRLMAAFLLIAAVLVLAGTTVATRITSQSLEARADGQLANDETIVKLGISDLEDRVSFYGELLASAEVLTEQLGQPTVSRSLTIALLGNLRRERMEVRLYQQHPLPTDAAFEPVSRAFLGLRATALIRRPSGDGYAAGIESVSPVESASGVERAVSVSFPLSADYLYQVRRRIGSDITFYFAKDHVVSTLDADKLETLLTELHQRIADGRRVAQPRVMRSTSLAGPTKTRVSPLRFGMRQHGLLLLTMPLSDLLAAKRTIYGKGLLVTAALFSLASVLYLSLLRRITMPLKQLSAATREIARGTLDLRVDSSSKDEVGELAASFNVMVHRLKQSRQEIEDWNRTLERKVADRTRSLHEAQRELQFVNERLIDTLQELRETQDQMIQTEKLAAVGQMAATMAHEIKNPLAGIRSALEVIVPELADSPYRAVLEQILEQVDRLGRTSSRLLSFARPADPQRVATDVAQLIENTRFLVSQQAKRNRVEIRLEAESSPQIARLDPQLTTQAFLNIVLNAIQAMKNGGVLTIRTRWLRGSEEIQVGFSDTGEGMSADVLGKVFTPFFTTKTQGTGLGLYVVRDVVERQGGTVSIESAPGQGTIVTVSLPAERMSALEGGHDLDDATSSAT